MAGGFEIDIIVLGFHLAFFNLFEISNQHKKRINK